MNWPTVALGDVASIDRQVVTPDQISVGTTYIGLEHIARGGRITGRETIGDFSVASAKHLFSQEHILYGKLRPNLGKIARPSFNGVCSTDILPIIAGEKLDSSFLFHYLSQPHMVEHAASRTSGANLPRLSPKELTRFPVPLPPYDEQRRIAEILDLASRILSARRTSMETARQARTALFESLSTEHLTYQPLGDLTRDTQIGLVRGAKDLDDSGEYQYVRMDAITADGALNSQIFSRTNASASEVSKYTVSDGDLLFNTRNSRELVGKSAIYRGSDRLFNNNLMRMRFKSDIKAEYIHAYLVSKKGRAQLEKIKSGTTSVFAIYAKSLLRMEIPLPTTQIQDQFVAELDFLDALVKSQQAHMRALHEMYESVSGRLFRGEL